MSSSAARRVPAWRRVTQGESRWPVVAAILVALALQVSLPDQLTLLSRWLLPGLELALVGDPVDLARQV